jgi:hypothetical protein
VNSAPLSKYAYYSFAFFLLHQVKDFAYPLLRSASGGNILFEFMRTCESADGKVASLPALPHPNIYL